MLDSDTEIIVFKEIELENLMANEMYDRFENVVESIETIEDLII